MSLKKKLIAAAALVAAVPLVVGLAGCASDSSSASETVKIGVVGASDPYWATYVEEAKAEGITVEIVDFTDYAQPNPALTNKEIDLNQFQHIVYLADYNANSGEDLTVIGSTAIYPLGLYSTKYTDVKDIPAGSTVAVPNDESNQARGLLVLQSAGLIEIKGGGTIFSTLEDIDTEKSKVTVTALDASLTATSLPDVAAAIINNDFLDNAGLTPQDSIATDDPSDPTALPYINIFAARAEDKDNETYKKLVEIYQNSTAVQDGVQEVSGGTAVFVKTPVADLVKSLKTVTADTKAHNG